MKHPCKFCRFPTPDYDRLPVKGGGVAHATCGMDATRKAMRAGEFDGYAATLLKRRIRTTPNKENDRAS